MIKRILSVLLAAALLWQPALAEEGQNAYTVVSKKKNLYSLADTGYLIEDYQLYFVPEAAITQAESFNKVLSAFPDVKTYVYLATSSRCLDFNRLEDGSPLYKLLKEQYPNSALDCLPVHSFEDYCKYFYKTDHHWNYQGSYMGYTQIIRMMLGEEEPLLEPLETVTFNVNFNGSLNELIKRDTSDEKFTVYRFDYPEMTIRVNGKKKAAYGNPNTYFNGKYNTKDKYKNHYAAFYGGDVGLLQFSTGDESKENVIIFANSFGNAVAMLIASHFNNTYFIDMRHYKEDMGEKLNLTNSIKKWNISKVMLMGDPYFYKWGTTYR